MANGDCYEGSWENGVKHGRGTYYYAGQKGERKEDLSLARLLTSQPATTFSLATTLIPWW